MKKLILVLSLFFALSVIPPQVEAQEGKPAAGFVISVTAENAGNKWIYISRRQNGAFVDLDSARTEVFPVVIKGKLDVPEMLYLRITGSKSLVPVFCENSVFKVFADFDKPETVKVEGSSVHAQYDSYANGLIPISNAKQSIYDEFRTAQKANDEEKMVTLDKKYEELEKREAEYSREFVMQNKSSFVSPYIIRREMYYTLNLDELKNLVGSLDPVLSNSVYTIDLNEKIAVLEKVEVGQKFTDIILPGVDDQVVKLSDFTGENVILVDFWASWCGPCRQENPNVVKIYQEYKSKGFDIVGVSFDTNKKAWMDAIQKDKLAWRQMSDLKGWNSKAAELYAIASIPNNILIDRDGTIIAKNLVGDDLKAKLSELLD